MIPKTTFGRIVLMLLAMLAASEIGLRVLTDYDSRWNVRLGAHKQFDPIVQFRNKPNYDFGSGTRTNSLGYQAPEPLSRAPALGVLRLIYLGDSNTVMPLVGAYPQQVEPLVEAALGIGAETVNAAVPGYSSLNARKLLESELSGFDAHYLFVYLGWNDLGQYGPEGLPYKLDATGYAISPIQRVLTQLYSLRYFYALRQLLERHMQTVDEPLTASEERLYGAYEPKHFAENLAAILKLATSRYPHVYVMTLASLTNDDPTKDELSRAHFPTGMGKNMRKLDLLVAKYNAVVARVAASESVPLLDLHAAFDSHEARRFFTDSCHMDRDGAARIARLIASEVEARESEQSSITR